MSEPEEQVPPEEVPEEVVDAVRAAIAESLALAPEEIELKSRLVDELGADSLDLVDIIFMLEQRLGIRVRETELNFLTRLDFSSPEVMREGRLTREVVDRLAEWIPALAEVEDRDAVTPEQLFSSLTVEALCTVAAQAKGGAAQAKEGAAQAKASLPEQERD